MAFVPWFPDAALGPRWVVLSLLIPFFIGTRQSLSLLLIACTLSLGLIRSPVIWDGLYIYWHLLIFAACVLAAPVNMRPVYLGAGIGLALNGLLVAAQYWGGWYPFSEPIPNSGLFSNKNVGAEMAALVLVGLFGARLWGFVPFVAVPLVTQPLSRGAALAAGLAGVCAAWHRHRFATILAGIVLIGVIYHLAEVQGWGRRVFNVELRLTLWAEMLPAMCWWGNGLGSFIWAYPWMERAHNDFLQVAYELGLPGALLFLAFFGYCLWSGPLTERLVILAFLVAGCFGFPLYIPGTVFIAGLAAGSILRHRVPLFGWQRLRQLAGDEGDRGRIPARARAV